MTGIDALALAGFETHELRRLANSNPTTVGGAHIHTAILALLADRHAAAEALFASNLQPSGHPTDEQELCAIADCLHRYSEPGCADLMAGEFGEHPELAAERMRWCLDEEARLAHQHDVELAGGA